MLAKNFILLYVHSPIKMVLSAFSKWDIVGPLFGILTPQNIDLLYAVFIAIFKPSITIINRKGESGSPFLTSLVIGYTRMRGGGVIHKHRSPSRDKTLSYPCSPSNSKSHLFHDCVEKTLVN